MINVSITGGEATLVLQDLQRLNQRTLEAAAIGLASGLRIVAQISQDEFLNGPRPQRLAMVTGRLRRSIAANARVQDGSVTGTLDTNVPYGAFHEGGFHGSIQVREHTRKSRGSGSAKQAGLVTVELVREHTREVDYDGRPFLAPALSKGAPIIFSEIQKALAVI